MSGIAAILERSGAPAGEERIAAMLARLRRRGPDRSAFHVAGPAALAQATLETLPEDAFDRQPLASRSGTRWIIADARVDNRGDLLERCAEPGDVPERIPDAALILRAYERWGEACPSHLIGDFAFVVWDGEARRLFCARDHLGVRQLYYHHDAASFRCASEMDVLFTDERVPRRADRRSLALFLASAYDECEETLYEGVRALPAGHTLIVTATSIRCAAYWRLDPYRTAGVSTLDDAAARFSEVFGDAVRCRLRAHRPVAAQVSGGLDSSSVLCEAARQEREGGATRAPLVPIRAVFPGLPCDEQRYSDAVAARIGLPILTSRPLERQDMCKIEVPYPDLYFHPTGDVLDPLAPELHRAGVRVVLTGTGGDLLQRQTGFDGAQYLRRGQLGAALDDVMGGAFHPSWGALRRLGVQGAWALAPGAVARLKRARRAPSERWPWLSTEAAGIVDAHLADAWAVTRRLHPDLPQAELCRGLGDMFYNALQDRSGAYLGLDHRHPFLDVRVIELLLSLPLELRFTQREGKRVLRQAMRSTLPSVVRERRDKADFTSYVRRAFLTDRRGEIRRLLDGGRLSTLGLVQADPLRRLLDAPPDAQDLMGVASLVGAEAWLQGLPSHTIHPHRSQLKDHHEHA